MCWGTPRAGPSRAPQPDPFLGTLKTPLHSASALSPGLSRLQVQETGAFCGLPFGGTASRCPPACAFPVVQGAAQPSLPLALLLQQANKSLLLSVWLLSQWTGSSWLLPGRPRPCSSAHRGTLSRSPYPGLWLPDLDSVCEAVSAGPWEGWGLRVSAVVRRLGAPQLCIPAHLLPRPHPGRSWRLFPRASPYTHPHGLGGQRSTSQPRALSPWQRDSAHSPPRSMPRPPANRLSPSYGASVWRLRPLLPGRTHE